MLPGFDALVNVYGLGFSLGVWVMFRGLGLSGFRGSWLCGFMALGVLRFRV